MKTVHRDEVATRRYWVLSAALLGFAFPQFLTSKDGCSEPHVAYTIITIYRMKRRSFGEEAEATMRPF
jgi:hypothetical protein